MKRQGLSKRTRFEIFKRDGFKCVYCGATPVDGPLHVDHVTPLAEGGTSDEHNLVTACESCNLGKSSVPLNKKRFSGRVTEADTDHAEQLREYLAVQREVANAKRAITDELVDYWCETLRVSDYPADLPARLAAAMAEFDVSQLMEAIAIVASRRPDAHPTVQLKYFHGILRNWRNEGG